MAPWDRHCYLAGVWSYSRPRSYSFRNHLCLLQLNSVEALQVALNLTRYNAVPALLAHSYLILGDMLKVLALHANAVIVICCLSSSVRAVVRNCYVLWGGTSLRASDALWTRFRLASGRLLIPSRTRLQAATPTLTLLFIAAATLQTTATVQLGAAKNIS
jgi:hypothetical protein